MCGLRYKKKKKKKERRFAKLGYLAATVVYQLEDNEDLLQDVKSNNQLVQACRVYLQCDFVIIGLKVLSWFTSAVTLIKNLTFVIKSLTQSVFSQIFLNLCLSA